MKIHHCIADGIATTQMLAKFSDDGGGRRDLRHRHSRRRGVRRGIALGLPKLRLNPLSWVSDVGRATFAA